MIRVLSLLVLVVFLTTSAVALKIFNDDLFKREECKDLKGTFACESWKADCKGGNWKTWMEKNCKKTCNKCSSGQVKPAGNCKDIKGTAACQAWKADCTNAVWKTFMEQNCRKTCNKCSGGQVAPTKAPTKPPTKPSVNCNVQEHFYCANWKKQGLCKQIAYRKFITDKCPITCGFCPGVTVKKPEAEPVGVNIQECLKAHNDYRAEHGASPLTWDPNMASQAQAYAMVLAKAHNGLKHAKNIPDGENLAYQGGAVFTCKQATKNWYDEVSLYNYANPGFSMATGHFTQVVWKSTKRLGVGIAKYGHKYYVVARYSPPGNFNTRAQFQQNVGPKQS